MNQTNGITINPTFRDLIAPMAADELAQLEANIAAQGCRDPLVTWRGVLLDGHNRYAICERRKIEFKTVAVELPDEDAAKIWIIQNQFGRRNLAPYARVELALKLEPLLKKKAKANQANGKSGKGKPLPQNSAKADTRAELAKIAGVSHDTIAKGKMVAQHADEATKRRLRENKVSVHRVAKEIKEKVIALQKKVTDGDEEAKADWEAIKTGETATKPKAAKSKTPLVKPLEPNPTPKDPKPALYVRTFSKDVEGPGDRKWERRYWFASGHGNDREDELSLADVFRNHAFGYREDPDPTTCDITFTMRFHDALELLDFWNRKAGPFSARELQASGAAARKMAKAAVVENATEQANT